MTDTKCNGFKNYQTWTVNLFLNSEFISEIVKDMDVNSAAEWIQDHTEESLTKERDGLGQLADQLISGSLNLVDYHELAEHYIKNAD